MKRKADTLKDVMEGSGNNKKRKMDGLSKGNDTGENNKQDSENSQKKKRKREDSEDHHQHQDKKVKTTESHEKQQKNDQMKCCQRVVDPVKKWVGQVKQCQDKKRKRQDDTEDRESQQAKRPKRQDAEAQGKRKGNKRRLLLCCQRYLHHLIKEKVKESEDVLRVRLEAYRVLREMENVSSDCCVHLEEENQVSATVGGKPCLVLVDSGASASVVLLSLGRRLGLVTGREKTVKRRVSTWCGVLELDVIKLDEVVVVLKGGVSVNTPLLVFPKEMEKRYNSERLVLSMSRLKEAEVYQEFHQDRSSSLFLRYPERLLLRYEKGRQGKVLTLTARTPGVDEPLTLLVDTGAGVPFCISKDGLDKVRTGTHKWIVPPRRVRLQLDRCSYTVQQVKVINVPAYFHFAIGRTLLYELNAAIDYVQSSITFTINRRHYRLTLLPR